MMKKYHNRPIELLTDTRCTRTHRMMKIVSFQCQLWDYNTFADVISNQYSNFFSLNPQFQELNKMAERYSNHMNEYSTSTLMGNWFEDKLKAEIEAAERNQNNANKNRELLAYKKKCKIALKQVELTNCHGQSLKYGDIIMLQNDKTNGVLSTDADENEKIWRNGIKALQSTTTMQEKYANKAFARNSFTIEAPSNKANKDGFKNGDSLHYGQPFCLSIHPSLSEKPYFLHSEIMSHLSSANFSRSQMVIFHPDKSSATTWKFMSADHTQRVEYDTLAICVAKSNHVVIEHTNTRSLLASDNIAVGTDFGTEYQTSCKTFNPDKRVQTIKKEILGFGADSRGELDQNKWRIIDSSILSSKSSKAIEE